MADREKVFDAFRNCITEPKCKDCPWEQCEQFNQKKVTIPATLALDVLNLLNEQENDIHHMGLIIEEYEKELKKQEAVEPRVSTAEQRCGHCNKVIEMDGWQSCPWCGKRIDWKGWWKKNGTRNQDS